MNLIEFAALEATACLEPNRFQPELRNVALSLDMRMRWFAAIGRIDKKAVWANPQ